MKLGKVPAVSLKRFGDTYVDSEGSSKPTQDKQSQCSDLESGKSPLAAK